MHVGIVVGLVRLTCWRSAIGPRTLRNGAGLAVGTSRVRRRAHDLSSLRLWPCWPGYSAGPRRQFCRLRWSALADVESHVRFYVGFGASEEIIPVRSFARRRSHQPCGLEARVAHDGAEPRGGHAGRHRSRPRRPADRIHRQRRHRRQLADLPRRHRLHGVALHRAGGAGRPLCRRR